MSSMIESLIGAGSVRPDEKRIITTRRPLPSRARDFFEILVALGDEATLTSFFLSADLRAAEPRTLTYIMLGRWPTAAELAALPQPYNPPQHLRTLLTSAEFRASLTRRICDAYPERPRLCFIRIPRCAGAHFLSMAEKMHPILPPGLAAEARPNRFVPDLGRLLGRFTLTKTIMLVQPTLAPFIQAATPRPVAEYAEAGMQWALNPPPRRAGDRLFTILREPTALVLSQVNATVDALCRPRGGDTPAIAALRATLPRIPNADRAGLAAIARQLLQTLPVRNPICHALADGTAAAALAAIRLHDVELADLSRYPDWTKYTWDVEAEAPPNAATPHLTWRELSAGERAHVSGLVAEDVAFYAPIRAALDSLGELRPSVRGREV